MHKCTQDVPTALHTHHYLCQQQNNNIGGLAAGNGIEKLGKKNPKNIGNKQLGNSDVP